MVKKKFIKSFFLSLPILLSLGFTSQTFFNLNQGCPVFHCNSQATSIIPEAIVRSVTGSISNNSYGKLKAQGCSGNGSVLACLFFQDNLSGNLKGVLKVIDSHSLNPIWGSYNSQELDSEGILLARTNQLPSHSDNMGLTPVDSNLAVVSQVDGTLSLLDLGTWTIVDSKVLVDGISGDSIKLVSPSSGNEGKIYAVGKNTSGQGYLFSIHVNKDDQKLEIGSQFIYDGPTGASPVIVTPAQTGLDGNLILLHTPGLNGDGVNYLMGIEDTSTSLILKWQAPLSGIVGVSPTIDETTKILYLQLFKDGKIYAFNYIDGLPFGKPINLVSLAQLPSSFKINAHMAASNSGGKFTLLVSGAVTSGSSLGQYVFAISPGKKSKLFWMNKISTKPMSTMAAWNSSASSATEGFFCPIIASPDVALTRICND